MDRVRLVKILFMAYLAVMMQACNKTETQIEQQKFVMVAQPEWNNAQGQSYAGEVEARQQTSLAFRVSGQIVERYVDVGARVQVGQVLAKLDVKDAVLQMNSARAQFEQAESAELNAKIEYQRFKKLLPENAVSRSQYDSAENDYKTALSNLKQARANYEVAKNQTQYNLLIANKNGVITERDIEVGQFVSAGQVAYQLAIDGDREVVIGVPEQVIHTIRPQQQAWVSLWSAPKQRYAAYVREISPAADQSRTFRVKVALKDTKAPIQLGQSARVYFENTTQAQLTVPLASISAVENKAYLWIVQADNTLERRWVTIGEYQREAVPVISGLQADQWVVVGGVHLLTEKQKVQPIDRENRPVQITKKNIVVPSP